MMPDVKALATNQKPSNQSKNVNCLLPSDNNSLSQLASSFKSTSKMLKLFDS